MVAVFEALLECITMLANKAREMMQRGCATDEDDEIIKQLKKPIQEFSVNNSTGISIKSLSRDSSYQDDLEDPDLSLDPMPEPIEEEDSHTLSLSQKSDEQLL